jgi:ADP-heptose:LPS heptosyltransferase
VDNYAKSKLRKKISRLVKRGLLENKQIILFGASVYSKEIKNCLTEYGFSISGIIDNDSRKIAKECMGLTVQRPESALLPYNENRVIMILSGGFYREMTQQLLQMGYIKNKQIFILNFKTDESLPVMAYNIARTIRGEIMYKKLVKGHTENCVVFIAPYTGTGDIYLVGLFFNEFLRQNNIADYVFVVVSGACKKVAEMFNIRNIVVVKPILSDDIINAKQFLRASWNVVVLNDGWLGELTQWLRGYKGLNFERVFRKFVFNFDDNVHFELPPKKDCTKEIDALFEKYALKKGKTVVLSPYSNTLFELPDSLWEAIAEHFRDKGYTVCTNCAAASEKAVKGTTALFFPLGLAIDFLNAAGTFIGIRSGLCDIISSSDCKKIILYEKDNLFYKSTQFEYFSLAKMGLCGDAVEIEYHNDLKNDCLQNIFVNII